MSAEEITLGKSLKKWTKIIIILFAEVPISIFDFNFQHVTAKD